MPTQRSEIRLGQLSLQGAAAPSRQVSTGLQHAWMALPDAWQGILTSHEQWCVSVTRGPTRAGSCEERGASHTKPTTDSTLIT